jgi:hypothetical protein
VAVCFASRASALATGSIAPGGSEGPLTVERAEVVAAAALRPLSLAESRGGLVRRAWAALCDGRDGFCVASRAEVGLLGESGLRVAIGVPGGETGR